MWWSGASAGRSLEQQIRHDGKDPDHQRALEHIADLARDQPVDDRIAQGSAPTVEPIAAVPKLMITEMRMPARIVGAASGNSTSRRSWKRAAPWPRRLRARPVERCRARRACSWDRQDARRASARSSSAPVHSRKPARRAPAPRPAEGLADRGERFEQRPEFCAPATRRDNAETDTDQRGRQARKNNIFRVEQEQREEAIIAIDRRCRGRKGGSKKRP